MKNTPFYKQAELLLEVLPIVAKHEVFALKGGTAINFFVRDLPRLSVDIDLTYLPIAARQESLSGITQCLHEIKEDLEARPGTLVAPKHLPASGNLEGWKGLVVTRAGATIKIEPNLTIRGSVFSPESLSLTLKVEEMFECALDMLCLSKADLYGGKICAALDRQHPRDLFDVRLLLQNEGFSDAIRQAFIVYLISHNRPMVELLDPRRQDLQSLYDQEFSGMAWEPVPLKKLLATREDMIDLIQSGITVDERRFLLSVKEGDPQWDLLGIHGIADLPAVQWKLLNIRNMNRASHQQAVNKLKVYLEL
jgi:predicted nucleotidyltransferase component of viral defense system